MSKSEHNIFESCMYLKVNIFSLSQINFIYRKEL